MDAIFGKRSGAMTSFGTETPSTILLVSLKNYLTAWEIAPMPPSALPLQALFVALLTHIGQGPS